MVCKLMKKGVVGTALTAGALYLAFGTHAPSYVRTAFHKVRHTAKDSVPIRFDIERARDDIAALAPAIDNNKEELARAEVDVETLKAQITTTRANLDRERRAMVALRQGLSTGDLRLAGEVSYTPAEVKAELAHKLDSYRNVSETLKEQEATLRARESAVHSARQKLVEMARLKRTLAIKLESIQARLQAIEASQDRNEFNFDDGALARAKQTVSDLERRLAVKARVAEMEGHFSGGLPLDVDPGRDVVKEFDEQFGPKAEKNPGDKSL